MLKPIFKKQYSMYTIRNSVTLSFPSSKEDVPRCLTLSNGGCSLLSKNTRPRALRSRVYTIEIDDLGLMVVQIRECTCGILDVQYTGIFIIFVVIPHRLGYACSMDFFAS